MPKNTATEVLNLFWDKKLPVDLLSIAKDLGISVRYLDSNESMLYSGRYDNTTPSGPICYINPNDIMPRQRFTLAHEIAHHVLQHGPSLRDTERSMTSFDPKERDANVFAANLLMPEIAVRSMIEDSGIHQISTLSHLFGASIPAIRIRLKELGYVF